MADVEKTERNDFAEPSSADAAEASSPPEAGAETPSNPEGRGAQDSVPGPGDGGGSQRDAGGMTGGDPEAGGRGDSGRGVGIRRVLMGVAVTGFVVTGLFALVWSREPARFDVEANARFLAQRHGVADTTELPRGYLTVATLVRLGRALVEKGGGYLANDIMPPGVVMDDMPSWEYGVLTQIRLCLRVLVGRLDSGARAGGLDPDLEAASKAFETEHASWIFPAAETAYREGCDHLQHYLDRLLQAGPTSARVTPRGDVLKQWLGEVDRSLGRLSGKLAASVGPGERAGPAGAQGPPEADELLPSLSPARTPWAEVDDVFYTARGTGWALVHLLNAVAVDFEPVIAEARGGNRLQSILRDLEGTQKPISSPVVLNGDEFGVFANHSLVMSAYLSRAETGIMALRAGLK